MSKDLTRQTPLLFCILTGLNLRVNDQDKIIVYSSFETVIEANIAKTKLDAYGMPCFLTDENLAGLYPLSYFKQGQVRLHIFEQDFERVKEILSETEDGSIGPDQ